MIRTRKMMPPKDDLWAVIRKSVKEIAEKSIVVVASKVVAIHQGRCVKIEEGVERDKLARQEAEWYVDRDIVPGEHIMFTIKNQTIIASAGIDKSNANGYFILWPDNPNRAAKEIYNFLKKEYKTKNLGVVVSDSHVTPMRRGVIGVAIGHYGFNPLRNYIGKPDIFGEKLKVTLTNVAESLAVAAVVVMGEGKEQTPLALISDVSWVEFTEDEKKIWNKELKISMKEDLFAPMLEKVEWKKGGGGRK